MMDTQPDNAEGQALPVAQTPSNDSPRRVFNKNVVFVPIEKRMTNGNLTFQTSDREKYIRTPDGVIRRAVPKKRKK